MSNKYNQFENQRQDDKDIPVGIPINMEEMTEANFDKVRKNENLETFTRQTYPNKPYYVDPQYAQQPQYAQPPRHPQLHQAPQMPPMMPPNQDRLLSYEKPLAMNCPCCKADILTVMNYETGNSNYLWAGLVTIGTLCCLGLPCCCCVPFMGKACMDMNHYCPQCGFNIIRKHQGCCEFN